MTKPVTLSNQAFAALRREKGAGESDSATIERLIREAKQARPNALALPWGNLKRTISANDHRAAIQQERRDDRKDPWAS